MIWHYIGLTVVVAMAGMGAGLSGTWWVAVPVLVTYLTGYCVATITKAGE